MAERVAIEVAYARPGRQRVVALEVEPGTTAREAVALSGIEAAFGEDLASAPLGVFGRQVPDDYTVRSEDRIEIYRPLERDPREARRLRAREQRNSSPRGR